MMYLCLWQGRSSDAMSRAGAVPNDRTAIPRNTNIAMGGVKNGLPARRRSVVESASQFRRTPLATRFSR